MRVDRHRKIRRFAATPTRSWREAQVKSFIGKKNGYHFGFCESSNSSLPMGLQKQVAALPLRRTNGVTEVLLVTSRETGRWIIPKGWRRKGLKGHKAAAREARQEAGVRGKIEQKPAGHFLYMKRERSADGPIDVTVFILSVRKESKHWPEADQRQRAWFAIENAAARVREPGLSSIIASLK
jgi:8-oxo-dGTP pyrophosphatase MutT (NUDIX family)